MTLRISLFFQAKFLPVFSVLCASPVFRLDVCSVELAREPVGGEELGPLRAMTATGAGLSLALNTAAASPYPSSAVVLQPCVSLNSQRSLQWDSVVGENYSNKKKIFKALSTSSSSSLGATTGLSLRFPRQQRCKEKRVPLAQVRRLPCCLFSLVDVDGITTRVARLLLFGQNFKALLLLQQHHNNMLSSIIHALFRLIGFSFLFFSFGEIGLGLGRKGAPEDYDFWSSGVWKGDAM